MFNLANSCLTTSSVPRFIDPTFQVPIHYYSLQHWTFLSLLPSTAESPCSFGPANSLFLELLVIALRASPVAHWTPSSLGGSSSGVLSFSLLFLFMRFSWQGYWSRLLFPSPVDYVLSEFSAMPCPSWLSLHGIASLHYTSPFATAREWSIKGYWWLLLSCCTRGTSSHSPTTWCSSAGQNLLRFL